MTNSHFAFFFSCLDYLHILHFTLFRSTLESASVVWSSITSIHTKSLTHPEEACSPLLKSFSLCQLCVHKRFRKLKTHIASKMRPPFALSLIQVHRGFEIYHSLFITLVSSPSLLGMAENCLCLCWLFHYKKWSFCYMHLSW